MTTLLLPTPVEVYTPKKERIILPRSIMSMPKVDRDEMLRRMNLVPSIEGASFLSGGVVDMIWSNESEGTALASSSTETSLLAGMTGTPQPVLPSGYLLGQQSRQRGVLVQAMGVVGSTSTPTLTFFVRIGTSIAVVTGTSIGQSAAMNGANTSNSAWSMQMTLTRRQIGMGAGAATWAASGFFESAGVASPFWYLLSPAASATVWTFTMDETATQYINVSAQWNAISASNTIQLKQMQVFGLN